MEKCLVLFDGEDIEIAEKIKRHISLFGAIVDTQVGWAGDIKIGENIDEALAKMVEAADGIIYILSANTNLTSLVTIAESKQTYALYVSEVADFIVEYLERETKVMVLPSEAIMNIGWHKGLSLAMEKMFGKKYTKNHKLKSALFWIPRLH